MTEEEAQKLKAGRVVKVTAPQTSRKADWASEGEAKAVERINESVWLVEFKEDGRRRLRNVKTLEFKK